MSLIKCSECSTEISDKAAACVKCGAPVVKPKDAAKKSKAADIIAGLIVAVVAIVWFTSSDDKAEGSSGEKTAAKEPACAKSDLQCLGDSGTISAGVYCQDSIERLAKHSVRWTDGMLEPKFSHFRWKDKEAGSITYVGNKAEFQNGFGAFTPVIYECDLASDNKTVLDIRVREGRLPS